MARPTQAIRGTLGLYAKLAVVLVPSFLLVSLAGLSWIAEQRIQVAREQMALRIGNAQARVGAGLERYSDRSDGAVDWSRPLVGELLNTLLSNPAVSCAELRSDTQESILLAQAPTGLGCRTKRIDAQSVIDLYTEPPTLLFVHYHEQELLDARQAQREFSQLILAGGLVAALMTSWLAFRIVVGRPLMGLVRGIEEARNTAQKASQVKSDFMAKMSHELRTPLNAIVGSVEVLNDEESQSDQTRDQLSLMNRAASDLLALVTDILDVAALEDGTLELDPVAYDPVQLVRDVAQGAEAGFAAKGIRLDLSCSIPVGRQVMGDAIRMRQVILNVLDNARRFTKEGQVHLNLSQPEADTLRFSVTDTGVGIAPERISNLFTAFEQAENDRSRAFDGAGLGLTISYKVVQAMGGRIDISSRLRKGTKVDITVAAPPATHAKATTSDNQTDTDRMSILVVEDNAANRKVMGAMLKKSPHKVRFAENGALAVEETLTHPPDLVFMDISMPVMDGHAATRAIRAQEAENARPPSRIVALTANTGVQDRAMARDAGMDDFLCKPVRRAAIDGAIAALSGATDPQNITPTSQSVSPGNAANTTTRTKSDTTKGATPA